jgi:hypothetical protein
MAEDGLVNRTGRGRIKREWHERMYGQHHDRLVGTNCQILPIKFVLYGKVKNVENLLLKFVSFV